MFASRVTCHEYKKKVIQKEDTRPSMMSSVQKPNEPDRFRRVQSHSYQDRRLNKYARMSAWPEHGTAALVDSARGKEQMAISAIHIVRTLHMVGWTARCRQRNCCRCKKRLLSSINNPGNLLDPKCATNPPEDGEDLQSMPLQETGKMMIVLVRMVDEARLQAIGAINSLRSHYQFLQERQTTQQ